MGFPTRPTMLKLEFIWLVKFSPQAYGILTQDSLDSLHYLGYNFWSDGPIVVKCDSLETRHPNLSNKPKIIEFGSLFREICLLEVGFAANVNAFITKCVKHVFSFPFRLCCLVPLRKPCIPSSSKAKKCENYGCMNPLRLLHSFHIKGFKRHTSSRLNAVAEFFLNFLHFFSCIFHALSWCKASTI